MKLYQWYPGNQEYNTTNGRFAYITGEIKAMMANGQNKNLNSERSKTMKTEKESQPAPLEKFNWLIYLQHVRGETEACMELINRELERSNGRNEFALHRKGLILRGEGKIQEALETFQKCLKLNPENVENLKEIAKCLYEMRRFKLSLEAYLEAERVSKNTDWEIYYYLAQCLTKVGDLERAKEYAHKAVKAGKFERCYALLIKILMSQGDLKSAIAVSNAAVESCPDSVSILTESGLLFLKMGQSQHAFERLSSALALEPTNTKALLGVGCITQKHEEYDVALSKYKIAVHYDPDSMALWNNIGMCFYSKQKYMAAISCLKRALWISPLNWKTLFNLGLAHLATSQPASAFNFICAAVNLRPDVADCFAALGSALMELKDPENATRAFRQALVLSSDDPVYLVNAAVCSYAAGYVNEACDFLRSLKSSMENGITATQEVMDLADRLSVALEEKRQSSGSENVDDASQLDQDENQISHSGESPVNTGIGHDETDIVPSPEFPSGDVTEQELQPDEV